MLVLFNEPISFLYLDVNKTNVYLPTGDIGVYRYIATIGRNSVSPVDCENRGVSEINSVKRLRKVPFIHSDLKS